MDSPGLTHRMVRQIRADFPPDDVDVVLRLLADWALTNKRPAMAERLRAAVVRLAHGDFEELADAVSLGELDWRDLLMAADLDLDDWPERLAIWLGPPEHPNPHRLAPAGPDTAVGG